jgi:pilus assembly protein Flp/PilA
MLTNLLLPLRPIRRCSADQDRGAAMVEYALLVALIAVVCIVAITTLGGEAGRSFDSTGSAISEVYNP